MRGQRHGGRAAVFHNLAGALHVDAGDEEASDGALRQLHVAREDGASLFRGNGGYAIGGAIPDQGDISRQRLEQGHVLPGPKTHHGSPHRRPLPCAHNGKLWG